MLKVIYPDKCILCEKLLGRDEKDLCRQCRMDAPEFTGSKRSVPFIAKWTSLWYYKDTVIKSIHNFKFRNDRCYAGAYGRLLAVKLIEEDFLSDCDLISWVPISRQRRFSRGYDQSELLAKAIGGELNREATATLRKIRNNDPQSSSKSISSRKANVLGVYQVPDKSLVAGKTILLVDDVLTTGATVSECAKMLLTAGAREIRVASIATSYYKNTKKYR